MKLWQKISLINIVVLLLVITVCSSLLLHHAKKSILELTIENVSAEQVNLRVSFSEMENYYTGGGENPIVKKSALKYMFSRIANENSVLVYQGETLYSSVNINPEEIMPLTSEGGQQVSLQEIDGRSILIVGEIMQSDVPPSLDEYSVYVVKDITEVYNNITKLFWRFVLISGTSIVLGMALIILLVYRASRPLIKLKNMTRRIAVGEYAERVEVGSRDEVGQLAADFNLMVDAVQSQIAKLEDTAERQRFFIGGLTHEFKTPMTSMLIHTDTLLSVRLDEAKAEQSLLHIHQQSRWLEQLTQKLLKLITLEEEIIMEARSVEDLFADVVQSTSEIIAEKNITLITECNIESLNMDYDLMKSLIINLIDNAFKASKVGQSIHLQAYDNIIEVTDWGKGIPKEEIAQVTDPFYMVDSSRSKEKGGSGLGLALVKKIADVHHADLIIESEAGLGTTFRLIFPHNKTFTTS